MAYVPIYIPTTSKNCSRNVEIELCKTLPNKTEQHKCLIELQKKWENSNFYAVGCFLVIVVLTVAFCVWMARD